MKRFILTAVLITFASMIHADNGRSTEGIFLHVPDETEIRHYMNLYERLKKIDRNELAAGEAATLYETFTKDKRYRDTWQALLFESYLLHTRNAKVRESVAGLIKKRGYGDEFSAALVRLYSSKGEPVGGDDNPSTRFNYDDRLYDENIDLFTMNERLFFNNELGIMMFDGNRWEQLSLDGGDGNRTTLAFVYGGGTNSINMTLDRYQGMDAETFNARVINSSFYRTKYANFRLDRLPPQGILSRAGADVICMGTGYGPDEVPGIESLCAVLYLYSGQGKRGYAVTYYMNYSRMNNNYGIRFRIYNHLVFQAIMSWIQKGS